MLIDHSNLSRLDLNLLVAFDALMTERHVTRAADRLHIGQPAMSHSLRRLRSLFDDDLLVRSGADMVATPRACQLADEVRMLLEQIQSTVFSAKGFDAPASRRCFTIGMSPSLEIALAPALLASVSAEAPGTCLSIRMDPPDAMLQALDTGDIDLCLGAFSQGRPQHRRSLLCEAEGYLCLFDAARSTLRLPISKKDFLRIPHVTVTSTDYVSEMLDQSLAALGVRRRILYRTPHVLAVPFLLRHTEAIALLCRRTALICARTFALATSPLPYELPRQQVAAVWHGSNDRDPGHIWLREKLLAAARTALN